MPGALLISPEALSQIVNVRLHLIVDAIGNIFVWPCVASAVRDYAKIFAERINVVIPGANIRRASVNKDNGVALACFTVGRVTCR